jgi:DNA polymerase-1
MSKILLLIDGSSLAYRSHYAFINRPLITSKGKLTSAIFGFARSLKKVLDELNPDYGVICFDSHEPTFRKEMYNDYKATRKKMPDELKDQIPYIIKLGEAAGFKVMIEPGYEADDIIATITEKAAKEGIETIIFTLDKDLMQLIRDNISILNMHTEGEEWINKEKVKEKFGIPVEKLSDFLSITGDTVDNIPGIKGIGKKTASKLLKQFESLEDIFSNLEKIKKTSLRNKLEGKKEEALLWKNLIKLKRDVPLEKNLNDLTYEGINKKELGNLLKELEFYSLLADWIKKDKEPINYKTVDSIDIKNVDKISIVPINDKFVISDKKTVMTTGINHAKSYLQKMENRKLITGDAKEIAHILGDYPKGIIVDLSLMHYLLYPNRTNHTIKRILMEIGLSPKTKEDEAILAFNAAEKLTNQLKSNDLLNFYNTIERPLIPVLFKMEKHGILFDISLLKNLRNSIEEEIKETEQKIYKIAGTEFNLRSPKQLSEILFDKMGLPVIKKTKTGYSTDFEVLSSLRDKSSIIPLILEYREIDKLKSAYIDCLIKSIDENTGRIYAKFQQTVASTGRITAIEPNLQTLPIRTERGRKIREAVIAPKGNLILSCDYSQIELRILAHLSGDEKLLEDFKRGEDIHTATASRIFNSEPDKITSGMRRHAKAINFGIIYGISPFGLSKQLNIPTKASGKIIETYYKTHPGVEKWQKETIDKGTKSGYVTTIFGRKRWIPELVSRSQMDYGKRIAINSPIQGSAADIMKKAMIEISKKIKEKSLNTKLILQIHDELLFEVPLKEKEEAVNIIVHTMESIIDLKAPLKVDYKFGKNWDEAH